MTTKANLHRMIDELGENQIESVAAALTSFMRQKGTLGAGGGGSRMRSDPFERFPPPLPFQGYKGGPASYSSLGEGNSMVERWDIRYFEETDFVSVTQQRFHGQAFQREERWQISPNRDRVLLHERIKGPGHESARQLSFSL